MASIDDHYLVYASALSYEDYKALRIQLDCAGLAAEYDPARRIISAYLPKDKTPADVVQLPDGVTFEKMNRKI